MLFLFQGRSPRNPAKLLPYFRAGALSPPIQQSVPSVKLPLLLIPIGNSQRSFIHASRCFLLSANCSSLALRWMGLGRFSRGSVTSSLLLASCFNRILLGILLHLAYPGLAGGVFAPVAMKHAIADGSSVSARAQVEKCRCFAY